MKCFTLIRPAAGLGILGASCMASAIGLAFFGATANISIASPIAVRVRVGDLNLSSVSGVEALKRRVIFAAMQVCGDYDAPELRRSASYHRCVTEAADRALAQVGVVSNQLQPDSR